MTARVKLVERSGLWPTVELAGGGFQPALFCPILSVTSEEEATDGSHIETSDVEDEEPQDINVDEE